MEGFDADVRHDACGRGPAGTTLKQLSGEDL